jgi:hypothetical protein
MKREPRRADTQAPGRDAGAAARAAVEPSDRGGLRPWHLLLVGVLAAAAAAVAATRGTGAINMTFVALAVASAGLVAAAAYRSLAPLASGEAGEQTEMLGGRTRAALEREKMLVLRSIKEVEFDRAMGKISAADFREMVGRLRSRAASLIRQIDGGGGYRELIERDLAKVIAAATAPSAPAAQPAGTCPGCGGSNDEDARFCKACGARLEAGR